MSNLLFTLPLAFFAASSGGLVCWQEEIYVKKIGDESTWKTKKERERLELGVFWHFLMNDLCECCSRDVGKVSHSDEHRDLLMWFNYAVCKSRWQHHRLSPSLSFCWRNVSVLSGCLYHLLRICLNLAPFQSHLTCLKGQLTHSLICIYPPATWKLPPNFVHIYHIVWY